MKDVFKEQLVKRRPHIKTTMAKAGLLTAAIFLMLLTMILVQFVQALSIFFPLLLVGIIFGTYVMFRRFNIEYEYVLTNNELDIDIIYGKSRRKRVFSANVRDFDAFRKIGQTDMEHSFSGATTRADFSGGPGGTFAQYEFVATYNAKRMRIIFEPNTDLLSSLIPHLKRGTYPASLR